MNFEVTEEQKAMRDLAAKYAANTIAPIHEQDEAEGRFRMELVKEMAKLGFWGTIIPEEYGGTNAGFLSSVLITEEISKISRFIGFGDIRIDTQFSVKEFFRVYQGYR